MIANNRLTCGLPLVVFVALAFFTATPSFAAAPAATAPALTAVPLGFEVNEGQSDRSVRFLARHPTHTLFLTADAAVLAALTPREPKIVRKPNAGRRGMVVTMRLKDARRDAKVTGEGRLAGRVNHFIGRDSRLWRAGIERYARVRYADVYPGIDWIWHARPGELSYAFQVAPGADPRRIAFNIPQARKLSIDRRGGLVITTVAGTQRQTAPRLYQLRDGRRQRIDGGFVLGGKDDSIVGFRFGKYDPKRPLIIDPTLDFSTFYGGSDGESYGSQDWSGDGGLTPGLIVSEMPYFDIDADDQERLYATGHTRSADFPGADAMDFEGYSEAFAMRIDFTMAGAVLGYATYLGGSSSEEGRGIAAAADGEAFVTGKTGSK